MEKRSRMRREEGERRDIFSRNGRVPFFSRCPLGRETRYFLSQRTCTLFLSLPARARCPLAKCS